MNVAPSIVPRCLVAAFLIAVGACGGDSSSQSGPPATLEVVVGDGQSAVVTNFVPIPPSVRVRDANGNALAGIIVRYKVQSGGGTVTGDSARTDASGLAPLGSWRLGNATGPQTLKATAQAASVTITATATPGAPAVIVPVTAQSSAALVAASVMPVPTIEVRDGFGNALAGVAVTFTVTLGGGTVTGGSVTTDAAGRAAVGSWALGSAAGLNRLIARAGNASLIFEAQALGAAPAAVSAQSPTSQSGFLRYMVPKLPRIKLVDEFGNPSPGIAVTFAIVGGGDAVLTGGSTVTDGAGVATPSDWRLGFAANSTVEATIGGGFNLPKVTFTATGALSPYLIDIRFVTPMIPDLRDAFAEAGLRWMGIITADIPDQLINIPSTACPGFISTGPLNEIVDDLVIFAQVTYIDGPGGVLGAAAPCVQRSSTILTSVGGMQFEEADLLNLKVSNRLVPVVTHEIGHVLGIGKAGWVPRGLLTDVGSPDPIFTGVQTNAIWPSFAISYTGRLVPVHNTDGGGSADSHWRESILDTELMTPFVEASGVFMPLSRLSVASLADLGYVVDMNKADPFLTNISFPSEMSSRYPKFLLNEVLHPAKYEVEPSGRLKQIN
ncbi:MAG: leishmanolysin-related zinc metalloendopeptidase [Gemmatimonadales bacterium]